MNSTRWGLYVWARVWPAGGPRSVPGNVDRCQNHRKQALTCREPISLSSVSSRRVTVNFSSLSPLLDHSDGYGDGVAFMHVNGGPTWYTRQWRFTATSLPLPCKADSPASTRFSPVPEASAAGNPSPGPQGSRAARPDSNDQQVSQDRS